MKKKFISSAESVAAMVLGLAALGCGGAIENAANGWIMLGWTAAALVLGGVAIVLLGLAVANCGEEGSPSQSRLRRASSPNRATATTAASGGLREELLGQRPVGCKRSEADAGSRNPIAGESRKKSGRKAG